MTHPESIQVRRALPEDSNTVAPLFDAYRVFYGKPSHLEMAREFIRERLERNESILFIALQNDGTAVGFTQLYPSFSSVSAARIFILNDLYVVPEARRRGVAAALLSASEAHAREAGAIRLSLSTAIDNEAAQTLYASRGWERDSRFHSYNLSIS